MSGADILDADGNTVQLKGIAMCNQIWDAKEPTDTDHNEASFGEIEELGFNCVRFYLSYHFFEDDENPYTYKESGFEWLNQNIEWAKKHGIRLILNTIDDSNTVYEFHFYSPIDFTHQNMEWAGSGGITKKYPSEDYVFGNNISYWTGCNPANLTGTSENGWYVFESDFSSLSENWNVGSVTLQAENTGIGGVVLFDDISVSEYRNGEFQRVIMTLDFETTETDTDFWFWSGDGNGKFYYMDGGYQNSRCLAICDTTSDANVTGFNYPLLEGCEYKINGKVKYIGTSENCTARPRIDYSLYETIMVRDISYLEYELMPYIKFSEENQVPVYIGEFGVCIPAWEDNLGAEQYVTDMLTLCNKYKLNFNYHAYTDFWFGLHRQTLDYTDTQMNEELVRIFKENLKE